MADESRSFSRLAEPIRRWIWEKGWTELRDVQERAVELVLGSKSNLIIAAATASGKTEAAFLPVCSHIVENPEPAVRALYISPLKALINDQFRRLDDLCEKLELPVHRWHGDVSSAAKRKVIQNPSGIVLITPESLEAQFVLNGTRLKAMFGGLDFIIVDELHSFIGTERGKQLQSLMHRLELVLRQQVRRIGLSATLGDMELARDYLRPGDSRNVEMIVSSESGQELRLQIRGYLKLAEMPSDDSDQQAKATRPDGEEAIAEHLFENLRGKNNLVFANSRQRVEFYADGLRKRCESLGVPNEFYPHHGSLSKDLREETEARLKDGQVPTTAVCTSTLEMGIDIGSVNSIAQVGVPPSVASLRQRLGRSGRRGSPSVLRIYILEDELTQRSSPQDAIRAELVQSIAMVRLLLAKWYEPPAEGQLHLSTLVQQTLSVIAQLGGASAADLYQVLCQSGPFSTISSEQFGLFLRGLGAFDLIGQMADGTIIPGEAGERLVNHYDFYSAFTSSQEYRIVTDGQVLGTLPVSTALTEKMLIIFAGRRWRVTSIDDQDRTIFVTPAQGGSVPRFGGEGGSVHDRVREEMLAVYLSTEMLVYLDDGAQRLLAEGRANFARLGLANTKLVAAGNDTIIFPWAGDRTMNTLATILVQEGFDVEKDGISILVQQTDPEALSRRLKRMLQGAPVDAITLARTVQNKLVEKYDRYLGTDLLSANYAAKNLDVEAAWKSLHAITEAP